MATLAQRWVRRVRCVILTAVVILIRPGVVPAAEEKPVFSFVTVADTHVASESDLVRFRQFLCDVQGRHPDFVLILGDLCGQQPEYLPRMKNIMDHSGIPVHVLPGNHDDNYGKCPDWYRSAFGGMTGVFDHKGWRFILNWSQSVQTNWLRSAISAVPQGMPVVFCQHYPPGKTPEVMSMLKEMAPAGGLRLALSGHAHKWREGRIGTVPDITLANGFFSGGLSNVNYYMMDVMSSGKVTLHALEMNFESMVSPRDNTPEVEMTSPVAGVVVRGALVLAGTARDDRGLAAVEVRVDGGPWRPAEGLPGWTASIDTQEFPDGLHLLECRAIDDAGQESIHYAGALCRFENSPAEPGLIRLQNGVDSYSGCRAVTVRRHAGSSGDLECWAWGQGKVEYSEFYIAFDLSKVRLPPGSEISGVSLVLYGVRQNFQSLNGKSAGFRIEVLDKPWIGAGAYDTVPGKPGWLDRHPAGVDKQVWPDLGGAQEIATPGAARIDLTAMTNVVAGWMREPAGNFGLAIEPETRVDYNFSAAAPDHPLSICRPVLELRYRQVPMVPERGKD